MSSYAAGGRTVAVHGRLPISTTDSTALTITGAPRDHGGGVTISDEIIKGCGAL